MNDATDLLIERMEKENLALDDELKELRHEHMALLDESITKDSEIKELKFDISQKSLHLHNAVTIIDKQEAEIKEQKQFARTLTNAHNRNTQIVEDLRKKLLERDEMIVYYEDLCRSYKKELSHLEYLSEPCREELEKIIGGDKK